MRRFIYLLDKEFKHILRDKFMPKLIFILPVIQLLILPFAADFETKNVKVCIVDRDSTSMSSRFSQKVGASKYFIAKLCSESYGEALRQVEMDKSDIILEIPKGFEKNIMNMGFAEVMLSVNGINGIKGGLGASYLGGVIADFSREIYAAGAPYKDPNLIEVKSENRYNIHLSTKAFIVPAVLVFLLSLIGGVLSALNIVSEKEVGTMEQMNVAPISKGVFIMSKIFPVWVVGMMMLTIGIGIAYIVYGLFPEGSFLVIYGFAAVYLTAFTAFGLIVSNRSSSAQQAILTFLFFIIIFLLMSGIFTPVSSMPEWAQAITYLNPLRYFVETIRAVYLRGAGFADLQLQFYAICAFALVVNVYAVLSFRRNVD